MDIGYFSDIHQLIGLMDAACLALWLAGRVIERRQLAPYLGEQS